jgi:hypothetical protein
VCTSAENGIGTTRRGGGWDGVADEPENEEMADDKGSRAGLNLEVVALEPSDFDDDDRIE